MPLNKKKQTPNQTKPISVHKDPDDVRKKKNLNMKLFFYFKAYVLYNYSDNFIKISLLSFIFWNYIIYLYIVIFP